MESWTSGLAPSFSGCLLGPEVRSGSVGFVNGNLDSKEERLLRPTFWKALPHLR